MRYQQLIVSALSITVCIIGGCSSSEPDIVPAKGRVTLNGKPLANVSVRFIPIIDPPNGHYDALAVSDVNGNFSLQCLDQDGACAAETHILITEGPIPKEAMGSSISAQKAATLYYNSLKNRPIPSRYNNLVQSPLKLTVSREQKFYQIELTR